MKYSFIIPIKNRSNLLKKGLESICSLNYDKKEFEVVIIDHMSVDNILDIIGEFLGKINIHYTVIDPSKYPYSKVCFRDGNCNPGLAQNIGAKYSSGKFLILTSPEVVHYSENLNNLDKIENLHNKFIYGYVLEKSEEEVSKVSDISNLKPDGWDEVLCDWNSKGVCISVYFIGVISRKVFIFMKGIDEKFMQGFAYEDDDFGNRVVAFNGITSEFKKEIMGIHLHHDRHYQLPESLAFNLDKKNNKEYLDMKAKIGWIHHVVTNRDREFGDLSVVVDSHFYPLVNI